jgi:excinuclease UvrABC nuclease subunit
MAIGANSQWFPWNRASILANAPQASGVYAIFNSKNWIYVGESGDIQARLLEHLNGDNLCIIQNLPTGFQFELVAGQAQRVARQNQLIVELKPVCNQKLG